MKDLTKEVLGRVDLLWAYRLGKLVGVYEVNSVEDVVAALRACGAYAGYGPADWQLMKRFIDVGSYEDIARKLYADFCFADGCGEWAFSRFANEFEVKMPKDEHDEIV